MRTETNHNGLAFAVLTAVVAIMTVVQPCLAQGTKDKVSCRIEGQVVDDPQCKLLLLLPEGADLRTTQCDTIMVNDGGRFAYELVAKAGEPYEIVADNEQSAHYMITFLAENGTVSITKYPYATDKRAVITSEAPLNKELQRVEKEQHDRFFEVPERERAALEESGNDLTPEAKELRRRMSEAENDSDRQALRAKVDSLLKANKVYTPEYIAAEENYRNAFKLSAEFLLDYAKNNVTPVGLYYLKNITYMIKLLGDDFGTRIADVFNGVYATEYPANTMSRSLRNWIASRNIRPGGRFIDFTAPDLDGKQHTLSEEIAGKVALIDFWASWCGPCRRNSKSMIPVYEAYRDRGFTIVGVARERDNDAAMRKAIERDGYPWLNLLELNDRTMLWERYGIGSGGGGTVLVDRDGTILAVNPKADEVERILSGLCSSDAIKDKVRCHIEGQIIGKPNCRMVLLLPDNGTDRWSKMDTIWVENGRFEHDICARENMVMRAIPCIDGYNDYSQRARFFVENGTVTIRFYADKEAERPEVESDAPLNKEMIAVEDYIFDTFRRALLHERHRLEEAGQDNTPEYDKVEEGLTEGRFCGERYSFEYARRNINLVGLHYLDDLLYNEDRCKDITEEELLTLFNTTYAPKYPDSSISTSIRSYIASRNIRPGDRFIDFTAPDLDGKKHTLSEEIAGKVALIDFWASWCGPCRRNSKSMIPVYEAYRDRGFTIVGVARERDNDAAMRKAIEHDGYPWLNLIELNDSAHIFDLYGLRNAAGGTVLVDRDGTILAVNPKADEVERILSGLCSSDAAPQDK